MDSPGDPRRTMTCIAPVLVGDDPSSRRPPVSSSSSCKCPWPNDLVSEVYRVHHEHPMNFLCRAWGVLFVCSAAIVIASCFDHPSQYVVHAGNCCYFYLYVVCRALFELLALHVGWSPFAESQLKRCPQP